MKLEGNEVEIGSYLVVLGTGCFYDQHPELPYFGRTMPPLGVPLRVTAKRLIDRVHIISFRDDEGIYHGAFEVGHCGHPISFYYRWPTAIELCEKFSGGSFDLNYETLHHLVAIAGSGQEQLKKALSFDFPPSSVDILGHRHYYYNPNTDRPKSLGVTNTTGKYIVGCDPYQESSGLKTSEPPTFKYKIGDRFTCNYSEYILAQVGNNLVCMVNLGNGNRYANPVKVSDVNNILAVEFCELNFFAPKK